MSSRSLPALLLLLVACGGGGMLYSTLTATPSNAPQDAFDCARSQLPKLEYEITSVDIHDRRITAKKNNSSVQRPESKFRGIIDKLEVEVGAGADGNTALTVVGHTFAEYFTVRGSTLTEEKASDDVNRAAQAVIQACGQP